MSRAVVDLRVDRPAAPGLVRAAAALRPLARVQAAAGPAAVAALATSPAAASGSRGPVAAWYEEGDDAEGFRGLLLHDPTVVPPPGTRAVAVVDGIDLAARPALSPFLRARWRARAGLPADLVVRVDGGTSSIVGGGPIPSAAVPAALALAAAVVVTGADRLVEAMACAAACVVDARSAEAVGAVDGVHVRVGQRGREDDARALAGDWVAAASLGRAARRLVERRWDRSGWLRPLVAHLLGPRDHVAAARMDAALAALRTPPDAAVVHRALAAVAGWA